MKERQKCREPKKLEMCKGREKKSIKLQKVKKKQKI